MLSGPCCHAVAFMPNFRWNPLIHWQKHSLQLTSASNTILDIRCYVSKEMRGPERGRGMALRQRPHRAKLRAMPVHYIPVFINADAGRRRDTAGTQMRLAGTRDVRGRLPYETPYERGNNCDSAHCVKQGLRDPAAQRHCKLSQELLHIMATMPHHHAEDYGGEDDVNECRVRSFERVQQSIRRVKQHRDCEEREFLPHS